MLRKTTSSIKKKSNDFKDIDILILCGGKGERLHSVVFDRPKALADIGGRPFLEILAGNLVSAGFKRLILSVGYLKEQIINHFKDITFDNADIKIEFSEEEYLLGTGGAVKKAEPFIKTKHFMVINGDAFFDLDFSKFYALHLKNNALLSIALTKIEDGGDYGVVDLNNKGKIMSFREKVSAKNPALINAGVYLMKKDIFSYMPEKDCFSLEYDIFPKILEYNCYGFVSVSNFIDIGVPERYKKAKDIL